MDFRISCFPQSWLNLFSKTGQDVDIDLSLGPRLCQCQNFRCKPNVVCPFPEKGCVSTLMPARLVNPCHECGQCLRSNTAQSSPFVAYSLFAVFPFSIFKLFSSVFAFLKTYRMGSKWEQEYTSIHPDANYTPEGVSFSTLLKFRLLGCL